MAVASVGLAMMISGLSVSFLAGERRASTSLDRAREALSVESAEIPLPQNRRPTNRRQAPADDILSGVDVRGDGCGEDCVVGKSCA